MEKGLCLEFFRLSTTAQPVYTHPYHKFELPKPQRPIKGVYVTINKLEKAKEKYNKSYLLSASPTRCKQKFSENGKKRPLTTITSNIFLSSEWQIFTPKTRTRRFRTNSVS